MSSMNKVILIGRVAANPELRYTASGKAVASFRIAVDRKFGGADKEADFFSVTAWQKLAEICNEFLTTGKLIAIDGRLQSRTYETQDGQKRTVYEIVAEDMQMLSPKGSGEGGSGRGGDYDRGRGRGRETQPNGGGNRDEGGHQFRQNPGGGDSFAKNEPLDMDDVPF